MSYNQLVIPLLYFFIINRNIVPSIIFYVPQVFNKHHDKCTELQNTSKAHFKIFCQICFAIILVIDPQDGFASKKRLGINTWYEVKGMMYVCII